MCVCFDVNVHITLTLDFLLLFWLLSYSPWRIVDDCGGAFTMGAIGGGLFQSVKGFRNAPVVSSQCNWLLSDFHQAFKA